jgi:hypothetical protein
MLRGLHLVRTLCHLNVVPGTLVCMSVLDVVWWATTFILPLRKRGFGIQLQVNTVQASLDWRGFGWGMMMQEDVPKPPPEELMALEQSSMARRLLRGQASPDSAAQVSLNSCAQKLLKTNLPGFFPSQMFPVWLR